MAGHKVTVATLHEFDNVTEDKINNVTVIRFPLRNFYWIGCHSQTFLKKTLWHIKDIFNLGMLKIVRDKFSEKDFDVIHTNNLSGFTVAIWSWANKRNIPVCHTARDYHLLHPNGTLFKKGKNLSPNELGPYLFSIIKKIKSKNVKSFIGISDYVKVIHRSNGFFKNAESYIVYNSIQARNHTHNFSDKEKIVLGFLGRVEEVKGIEHFLKSSSELCKKNYEIIIAGKGNEKYVAYLSKKYSNLNFSFVGTVDINLFFPSVDYLVVPSLWHEPMGRVVIEANSYGIPVIGSNRGGLEEIIKNDETGFIFELEGDKSLKSILEKLPKPHSSEFRELCKNALNFSQSFKSEQVVKSYIDIYKSTIEK